MKDMVLLEGFSLGHWTDETALTGCTVVLCPPETVASCEVRGSSPGSRELALLAPDKKLNEVSAVLLTGGSAFGLSAADGVVRWLEEQGRGYATPWGRVPIVPSAVIFDLNIGAWDQRPGPQSGYEACGSARRNVTVAGNIGVGCGATVGKWRGMDLRMKGGFGYAEARIEDLVVQACTVVNAVGDITEPNGTILAGARNVDGRFAADSDGRHVPPHRSTDTISNTTLTIVITNARLDKRDCFRVSQRTHDGFARAIIPVHTSYDGDASFVLSHGSIDADVDLVAEHSADVVGRSIRHAVRSARSVAGVPGAASNA